MSLAAKYLWAYLPCHADRAGRLRDAPFRLKLAIMPTEQVDLDALLDELSGRRHILRYVGGDGRKYIQIRNFHRYQNPHRNEAASDIPAPVGTIEADILATLRDGSGTAREKVDRAPALSGSESGSSGPLNSGVGSARDPATTEPAIPAPPARRYLDLPAMFAQTRTDVVGGSIDWAKPRSDPQKIREAEEAVAGHDRDEVSATMRRFWEDARSDQKLLDDSALAFGRWRSRFGNLLEAVHGLAPKAIPSPGARGSPPPTNVRVGHARAEQFDHTVSGVQKL